MKKYVVLALAILASAPGAYAQIAGGGPVPVVSSCGAQSYTAGQPRLLTQDTTGNLCAGGAISGTVTIGAGSSIIGYVNILGGTGAIMDTTPGGAAAPNALQVQGVAGGTPAKASADPCSYSTKINVPVSTASGTTALVAGVSNQKIYVCSSFLKAASAVAMSFSEGSSSTCGTSNQAAVIGVATNGTAANGVSFAANDGFTLGNGAGTVAATATNANYLCLFQSSTVQISGNITYVQQ